MKRITITTLVPTEAEIVLKIGDSTRPPTEDELLEAGLLPRIWLHQRIKSMTASFFDGESSAFNDFWYFLEYVAVYAHEPPEEAIEGMRDLLVTRDRAVRELLFLAGIEGIACLSRGGKGCVFRAVRDLRPDIAEEWEEGALPEALLRKYYPDHDHDTSPSITSSAGNERED